MRWLLIKARLHLNQWGSRHNWINGSNCLPPNICCFRLPLVLREGDIVQILHLRRDFFRGKQLHFREPHGERCSPLALRELGGEQAQCQCTLFVPLIMFSFPVSVNILHSVAYCTASNINAVKPTYNIAEVPSKPLIISGTCDTVKNVDWFLHCYTQYIVLSGTVKSGLDCNNPNFYFLFPRSAHSLCS